MKIENPAAFPVTGKQYIEGRKATGMTLLDYFAAKAMQVIAGYKDCNSDERHNAQAIAEKSYNLAKAMLKERQKHF